MLVSACVPVRGAVLHGDFSCADWLEIIEEKNYILWRFEIFRGWVADMAQENISENITSVSGLFSARKTCF